MNNIQQRLYVENNPYFRKGEENFLQQVMLKLPKEPRILEIGTFKGWSAILMAKSREDAFIITVDCHVGCLNDDFSSSYEEAVSNFKSQEVDSRIAHYPCSSQKFRPAEKFDLLFLDGDHTFAGVQHDFEKFWPYIKPEGIILFHDFDYCFGVTMFCKTLNFRSAKRFDSMLAIRKCDLC